MMRWLLRRLPTYQDPTDDPWHGTEWARDSHWPVYHLRWGRRRVRVHWLAWRWHNPHAGWWDAWPHNGALGPRDAWFGWCGRWTRDLHIFLGAFCVRTWRRDPPATPEEIARRRQDALAAAAEDWAEQQGLLLCRTCRDPRTYRVLPTTCPLAEFPEMCDRRTADA